MSSEQDHLKETDTEARFEFKKEQNAAVKSDKGLTEEVIRMISEDKDEPDWMLAWRLDVAHVDPLSTAAVTSLGNTKFRAGRTATLRAISASPPMISTTTSWLSGWQSCRRLWCAGCGDG